MGQVANLMPDNLDELKALVPTLNNVSVWSSVGGKIVYVGWCSGLSWGLTVVGWQGGLQWSICVLVLCGAYFMRSN